VGSTVDVFVELTVEGEPMKYPNLRDEEHSTSRTGVDRTRRASGDDGSGSSQLNAVRYAVGDDAIYVIGGLPGHLIKAVATAA
jgi:hypothetical protein